MDTRRPSYRAVLLCLAFWTGVTASSAQTQAGLELKVYAGLTITGEVGRVYQIQCVSDLAQSNNAKAWLCVDFVRLPTSPYLWVDQSAPASGRRFYQAVPFGNLTNMVFVPPGTFRMGSPTNEVDRLLKEGPQTEVTISRAFWIRKFLVTQGDYQALKGVNPSFFSPANGYSSDLTRPVDSVSWFNAVDYCAELTQQERAAGRIAPNSMYRLPTEAEWEYACRALTSTRFSYGDDPGYTNLTQSAWYFANSGEMSQPVGQKMPNPWGLYDMHGNLEEWCQDWFGAYLGGRLVDPEGPATGTLRILRGGYWEDSGGYCRSASRNQHDPNADHYHIGFRVLLAPGPPSGGL